MTCDTVPSVNQREVAKAIQRFPEPGRSQVEILARTDQRLAQLAVSFPLLIHALAMGGGTCAAGQKAIDMVIAGRPLAEVASMIGLPLCFRRVCPEALSDTVTPCRWGPDASKRLAPLIPEDPSHHARWIRAVSLAGRLGGDTFAVWVARTPLLFLASGFDPDGLRPLAIYCWHQAEHPDAAVPGLLRNLVDKRWSERSAIDTTVIGARIWFNRVKLITYFGATGVPSSWLPAAMIGDLEVRPLLDPDEIIEQAIMMHNCVDTYADRLARGKARLFSVRRNGQPVATFELLRLRCQSQFASLGQVRGRYNCAAPPDLEGAIASWVASHRHVRLPKQERRGRNADNRRLAALLGPYLATFDLELNRASTVNIVKEIDEDLAELARDVRVKSWLFSQS